MGHIWLSFSPYYYHIIGLVRGVVKGPTIRPAANFLRNFVSVISGWFKALLRLEDSYASRSPTKCTRKPKRKPSMRYLLRTESYPRCRKDSSRSTFIGVTGWLWRVRNLSCSSLSLISDTAKTGLICPNGTLASRVFSTAFVANMVELAPGAFLAGLKCPASILRKEGLAKTLTNLRLGLVGGRLLSTKIRGRTEPQFPVNLTPGELFSVRLPDIAKLLIIPKPITRL